MNRKILFRGKRADNGEWIYGDLIKNLIFDGREKEIRIGDIYFEQNGDVHGTAVRKVIPETVGQFTGLCDKSGNKIFEGDIVKIVGDSNNDDWKDVNYVAQIIFLDNGFCAINGTTDNYSLRRYGLSRCEFDLEVIGNIHDNPELLEVEQ